MNDRIQIDPITATLKQASAIMSAALKFRRGVGLVGGSGAGKTSAVNQAAKRHEAETGETVRIIWRNPAVEDSIDNRGALSMNTDRPEFVPIGEMWELFDDGTKAQADVILVVLEDFGGAPDAIKKAYMPLLLDNRDGTRFVNGRPVRSEVVVFFTSNRKKDKGGVNGMLDNVLGRVPCVIEIEPTLDDWIEDFAIPNRLPMSYIAWLKWNPQWFNDQTPRTDFRKRGNPRNHEAACEVLESWGFRENRVIEEIALVGAIGDEAALAYYAFEEIFELLPDFDLIAADPKNATVPEDNAGAMWAVSGLVAQRADLDNWAAVVKYTDRFRDREFAVFAILSAVRLHPELTSTQAYTDWIRANAHLNRDE